MTQSKISLNPPNSVFLEDLIAQVEQLPLTQQVALVERLTRLTGKQTSFSVVPGDSHLDSILVQINQMPPEQVGLILNAIAFKITREGL